MPVKCRFNLAMPDARHRRPLKLFLYSRSVKNQSSSFFISFSGDREAKFQGIFRKAVVSRLCTLAPPFAGMVAVRHFLALRASSLSRNRLFEFHKRRQFFIGVHNKHQPASQPKKTFLYYYASVEAFLKAKWQMIRPPNRSTIRTDVYEIRPRDDKP